MYEMKTVDMEFTGEEVGGEWACLVACISGCAAAAMVIPGGAAIAAYAVVTSAL